MKAIPKSMAGFLSAVAGALLVVAIFHLTLWGKDTAPNITISTTPVNRDAKGGGSYAPIVKKAAPSVVNISTSRTVRQRLSRSPFQNDPMFRQFFGNQSPTRREESLGSGVIISPDGYILTANHVVDGADEVKVAVDDGKKEFTAKVIGTDPPTDVAVLKIDATGLPAITLADSDQLEVGDIVLAIGNPFGIGQTVTTGIISALGRNGLAGFNQYQDFIQTDAAINPGNSGGALVDAEGRLVGINTAIIANDNGGNQGIGFAVPINMARHVVERLISGQRVTRGYLGVKLQDLDAGLAEQFGLPDQKGALLDDVLPGTPADKAGLKSGDVIIEFDGKKISDANSLRLMTSQMTPASKVQVKLLRNGRENTFTVTIAELPGQAAASPVPPTSPDSGNANPDALDGVTVTDLDAVARRQLQIPATVQGGLVTDVAADSNSAEAGLQTGDVIMEINRQPVGDAATAVKLGKQATGGQILLKIWQRGGDTHYLSVNNTKK
jgi:serine protease Do